VSHAIVISPEARAQLEALYDYIARATSDATALNFTSAILDRIDTLRDFPMRGAARDDILPGLRTIGFRRRVTVAFVVEASAALVVGVFHGGQDFETLLGGE
jgi:plasmid stabilization system protein ParE